MSVVFARETICVSWSAGTTLLKKDDAWDADSDLVRERPELFTEAPERLRGRRLVERATRAPGEVRATRAPRKAAKPEPEAEAEDAE